MVIEITPPSQIPVRKNSKSIFLAGTIDNGDSEDWQKSTLNYFTEQEGLAEFFKDFKTNKSGKKSAKGLLQVSLDNNGNFTLKDRCSIEEEQGGLLQPIFKNSVILKETTLVEIRNKLNQ